MTIDNNKSLLTEVSFWLIIVEVGKYPVISKFVFVSIMYCVLLI